MSQRARRVNELIKQAISTILHTDYRAESVHITLTEVVVSPDLRQATVFYSVLGDNLRQRETDFFLNKIKSSLRRRLGQAIILKYLPNLKFIYDPGIERSFQLMKLLDEL